jgi:hypothetical protein
MKTNVSQNYKLKNITRWFAFVRNFANKDYVKFGDISRSHHEESEQERSKNRSDM